jgi:2-iminobutanoate/2-iminopropanoate deaminase
MSEREVIYTKKAPEPGPYSQAIKYGGLIFVSGQTAEFPDSNEPCHGDIKEQTRLILSNIKGILEASGSSLEKVLKVAIFLTDIRLKPEMNEVYVQFFPTNPPARIALACKSLDDPLHLIEVDVIASAD